MRTSGLLPEECREEIRKALNHSRLMAEKQPDGKAGLVWRTQIFDFAWVLGDDDHEKESGVLVGGRTCLSCRSVCPSPVSRLTTCHFTKNCPYWEADHED